MLRQLLPRLTAVLIPALVALVIHACADATGPSGGVIPTGPRVSFSVLPSFQTAGPAGIVQFVKVRVVIRRADGSIALDQLVDFPVDADEVSLTFNVPLSPTAPATGEPLAVNLEMLNAAGEVVFRGGPINVVATQGTPLPPVNVPTTYTGPGATAQSVTLTALSTTLAPGDGVNLVARAFDQNNVELPGTPVQYSSTNPAVIRVPNPTVPVAEAVGRGTASVRATLVTGQSTELEFVVRPPATRIAVEGSATQTGGLGTALAQPLRVRVTAADGLGVQDVAVAFAVVSGGGTVANNVVLTDVDGIASVGFTVGSQLGAVSVRATTAAIVGGAADFAITAVPGPAASLRFVTQPVGGRSDEVMAPFAIEAIDAFGNRAPTYTGPITVAIEGGSSIVLDGAALANATLGGTFTVNAVAGLATFSAVRVDGAVSGARFRASAQGLTATSTSEPFTVSPLAATVLNLVTPPANGKTGNVIRVVADARNSRNEVVPAYVGTMVASIATGPVGGVIVAADRVAFVNGVASLELVVNLPGVYQINLSAPGLTPIITPAFTVANSDVTTLELVAGPGSIVAGGSTHPVGVVARDGAGDLVANANVAWAVTSGGGSALPTSSLTSAEGIATTQWTVGTSGAQTITASVGAVSLPIVTALSVAPATLRTWNGITSDDWHTAANWTPSSVPTAGEDVVIPVGTEYSPIVRAPAFARHLTVAAGASLFLDYADLSVGGNVVVGLAGEIEFAYTLVQESAASSGALNLRRPARQSAVLGEYYTYGNLIMTGLNTTLSASGGELNVNITVRNVVRAISALDLGECLYIETDAGLFDPNGYTVVVKGDLETYYGGRLRMQSASSIIEVHHEAYFGGGNTTGLLTAGELRLFGSLYQYGHGSVYEETTAQASVQRRQSLVASASMTAPRSEQRIARRRAARRALLTAGDTEGGLATPANFETSGTHKTRVICSPESPNWTGESCYSTYIEFTHPSESKQQNLSFEGIGTWYSYGGLRVVGAMKMLDGANLYDYSYAGLVAANVQGAERTRALNDARLARAKAALDAPETERISERSAVYGTACNYRLCIDGTLEGDATTNVDFQYLLLKGSIVGALGVDLYRLQMHGTNQVLSQVTNPGLSFDELRIFGTVSLVPGETVNSYYYGSAGVYSGGVLDLNGATLNLEYYGDFRTRDLGVLVMDDPNSTLLTGSALFEGGVSTLSAGTIRLNNNFTQGGTSNAFHATGTHTVVFGTASSYGAISFGTPGPGSGTSHFANLRFDGGGGGSVTLNSTVYVNGTFSIDDNVGSLTMYGNAHRLEAAGINIPGVNTQMRFARVQVRVGATGPLVLNNAVFEQFDAAEYEDQLTISRNGGTFTLNGLQFATPCESTYNYVVVLASPGAPTINFTNLSWPGTCPSKVALVGGAIVNGFNATPLENTWTGAVSIDWADPGNWSLNAVPTSTTNAVVAFNPTNSPVISYATAVGNLRMAPAANVRIAGVVLTVHGNLTLESGSDIQPAVCSETVPPPVGLRARSRAGVVASDLGCGGGEVTMVGPSATLAIASEASLSADLNVLGLVRPASNLTVDGSVVVNNGHFDVFGRTVVVNGSFTTVNGGVLEMTNGAGTLTIKRDAIFEGGSTFGLLTAGHLRVYGSLQQIEPIIGVEPAAGIRLPRANVGGDPRYGFNTLGTHVTSLVCDATSPYWYGVEEPGYCNTVYLAFDNPDESTVQRIQFEGPGYWVYEGGLKVADMQLTNGAYVVDYQTWDDPLPVDALSEPGMSMRARRDAVTVALAQRTASHQASRTMGEDGRLTRPRAAVVASEALTTCQYRLCVYGAIAGDATSDLIVGTLELYGAITGPLGLSINALNMRGTSQTLSQVTTPALSPSILRIMGNTSIATGTTFTMNGYTDIDVIDDGVLTLNGASLVAGDWSTFTTDGNGRLVMTNANDVLQVWTANFYGGYSTLTAGRLRVQFRLEQNVGPSAFQASGAHTVEFIPGYVGSTSLALNAPTVSGAGSRLANLRVMRPGQLTLATYTLPLDGTLTVDDDLGAITLFGSTIWANGVDIAGSGTATTFAQAALRVGSAGPLALNNAVFSGFTGVAADQLTLERSSGSFSFTGLSFTTPCAETQKYVVATGAATFNFPSVAWPGTCTEKITTSGGATVTGFVSPP